MLVTSSNHLLLTPNRGSWMIIRDGSYFSKASSCNRIPFSDIERYFFKPHVSSRDMQKLQSKRQPREKYIDSSEKFRLFLYLLIRSRLIGDSSSRSGKS